MCGIGGIISSENFTTEQSKFFEKLMTGLQARGQSAFGFVTYPKMSIIKEPLSVEQYLRQKKSIWRRLQKSKIALGHTRAVTVGNATNNENNHPFETDDFILAHNGTIRNHREIKNFLNITTDIETDSYSIVLLIQHYFNEYKKDPSKIVKAIQETRDRLEGGYACWLLYKKTGEVFLFKGLYGDLCVALLEPWNSLVFCSEERYISDIEAQFFPKSNKYFGMFNTNILTRKLSDDKTYKINMSSKNKRDITKIYIYNKNDKINTLPKIDNTVSTYNTFGSDEDILWSGRSYPKNKDRKQYKTNYYKFDINVYNTGVTEIDRILQKLLEFGYDIRIGMKKVKLILPFGMSSKLEDIGLTVGEKEGKYYIKPKISCVKTFENIEKITYQNAEELMKHRVENNTDNNNIMGTS